MMNYFFYDGINDLADKIKFYKKNDKLRQKISAKGRRKYFDLFNEVKTCKNIINTFRLLNQYICEHQRYTDRRKHQ